MIMHSRLDAFFQGCNAKGCNATTQHCNALFCIATRVNISIQVIEGFSIYLY